ncbi:MAG TPA: SGNH/GDSL hydrolase family protein [Candidatus Binatia bacterium]|jgi:lysophospholipase L1-like esterase
MRKPLQVSAALVFLALAVPAWATLHVMCYGDSITAGDLHDPDGSYPGVLQSRRADLDVVNEGLPGDVTENVERFRAALAQWSPQLVILLMGVNDPVCDPAATPTCAAASATPERTVENLLRMAGEARRHGTTVVILTPTPVVCDAACAERPERAFQMAVRQAFTGRVAEELRHTRPPPGIRIVDLRGKFTEASWSDASRDGLHPSDTGVGRVADLVAAQIPRPGAAATRVAATPKPGAEPAPRPGMAQLPGRGAHPTEPDPFVRRPAHP